jgi:hypothetical protein
MSFRQRKEVQQLLRPYGIATALVFAAGAFRRFVLPQWPLANTDFGYYWAPLNKLAGGAFEPLHAVNFLYPACVYALLELFRDFRAIGVVQHALGLLAGVLFLLVWRRLGAAIPVNQRLHAALGFIGFGAYILSNIPLVLEARLRADAVCLFAQMLCIWLAVEAIVAAKGRAAAYFGIAANVSCAVLAALKPRFLLAAVTIALVTTAMVMRKTRRRAVGIAVIAAVVVSSSTLGALQRYFSRDDPLSKVFLPLTLFSIHAKIIHAQMTEDLSRPPVADEWLRQACADLGAKIQETRERFPKSYRRLGFQPDYLINSWDERPALLGRWREELGDPAFQQFLMHWYWRALRERPAAFAAKVAQQISVFYSIDAPAFRSAKTLTLDYAGAAAALERPAVASLVASVPAASALASESRNLGNAGVVTKEPWLANRLNEFFRRTFLPVTVLSLIIASWLLVRRSSSGGVRRGAWLTLFLHAVIFANVLSISVVHSMEIWRYSGVLFPGTLLAHLWSISWIAALFGRERTLREPLRGTNAGGNFKCLHIRRRRVARHNSCQCAVNPAEQSLATTRQNSRQRLSLCTTQKA